MPFICSVDVCDRFIVSAGYGRRPLAFIFAPHVNRSELDCFNGALMLQYERIVSAMSAYHKEQLDALHTCIQHTYAKLDQPGSPIELRRFYGLLICYGAGFLLATIVLMFELFAYWQRSVLITRM